MPGLDLTGRHALVTGASSGIGKAAAVELARNGARVIVTGRDAPRSKEVVTAIRADGGAADFIALDLGDARAARTLARQALELGDGQIDMLVNNAGWGVLAPTPGFDESTFKVKNALTVSEPGFQFTAIERLGEVIVSAGTQAGDNVRF